MPCMDIDRSESNETCMCRSTERSYEGATLAKQKSSFRDKATSFGKGDAQAYFYFTTIPVYVTQLR